MLLLPRILQIMDLSTLLESKQLETDGDFFFTGMFGINIGYMSVHVAIEDWFDNNGCSYDVDEYQLHKEAHKNWMMLCSSHLREHIIHIGDGETKCTCRPKPEKPVYSTTERTRRLLSEVLASIVKVEQIDRIRAGWLEFLAAPANESEDEEDDDGASKGKGKKLLRDQASDPATRKASGLEMQERRKTVLSIILRERREEKERSEGKERGEQKDMAKGKEQVEKQGGQSSKAASSI